MRFSVLAEFLCGFAVLDDFFFGFAVSNIPQCPPLQGVSEVLIFKIHNTSTRDNLAIRKSLLKRCYYKTDKRT